MSFRVRGLEQRDKIGRPPGQTNTLTGEPKFEVPGGFPFVNWEQSSSAPARSRGPGAGSRSPRRS